LRDLLKQRLILDEGLRLKPYRCSAGKYTIGVGHNLEAKGISQKVADLILEEDMDEAINGADSLINNFSDLSKARQVVLCSMVFQMGLDGMKAWKNTLSCIQRGEFKSAAYNMGLSLWARQTPERAQRLMKMMEDG
jgi:lysozyme